jgi:hypothetical protein
MLELIKIYNKGGNKMKLYLIISDYRIQHYVVATSLKNAIKVFEETNKKENIVDIQFINNKVIMGE